MSSVFQLWDWIGTCVHYNLFIELIHCRLFFFQSVIFIISFVSFWFRLSMCLVIVGVPRVHGHVLFVTVIIVRRFSAF